MESGDLEANFVRPFGNIRDRHRRPSDHISVEEHLRALRVGQYLDYARVTRRRHHCRPSSWRG